MLIDLSFVLLFVIFTLKSVKSIQYMRVVELYSINFNIFCPLYSDKTDRIVYKKEIE